MTLRRCDRVLAAAPLMALALLAAACHLTGGADNQAKVEVVTSYWMPLQYGVREVAGQVRNGSDSACDLVRIEVVLLGERSDSLYSTTVRLKNLRRGERREFRTGLLPGKPAKFRIRSIRAVQRVPGGWRSGGVGVPHRLTRDSVPRRLASTPLAHTPDLRRNVT